MMIRLLLEIHCMCEQSHELVASLVPPVREHPLEKSRRFLHAIPDVMTLVIVFSVAWIPTDLLDRVDHVA